MGSHCWIWQGGTLNSGYGCLKAHGRAWLVHRLAYTALVDEIPAGLTVDHLCKNRLCVNPQHMDLCTRGENTLRGNSPAAVNARKTTCDKGHAFDREVGAVKARGCKRCYNAYKREERRRKRASA